MRPFPYVEIRRRDQYIGGEDIAEQLQITAKTVNSHRYNMLEKLGDAV